MFLSPVPPTFSLKTQGSLAETNLPPLRSIVSPVLTPSWPWGGSVVPQPEGLPSVVFTLRSPMKSPPIYLSFPPGMSALAKVLCPSLLCSVPALGKALQPRSPASVVFAHPGLSSSPGCPWLSPVPRARQVSRGVLWPEFVLQGENAMRNRVHCVIAQTCGGFFIKVVVG